jgi:tRNA (guanine-N7-)-methyltransferase
MSFGLSRGRTLDTSSVEIDAAALPPIPDDVLTNRPGAYLDPRAWFPHPERPLHVEIGSGKGTFLLQEAPNHPDINWLGMEYEREFFVYAADRIRRAGIPNIRMLYTDAADFVHWRLPDRSAHVIHLYFPDPWPKRKHNRRRMVQDRFLQDCTRVLVPGGELRVATDHLDYWAWMQEHFTRWTAPGQPFELLPFEKPAGAKEGELVGTNFERKYRLEGRTFNAAMLKLKPPEPRP